MERDRKKGVAELPKCNVFTCLFFKKTRYKVTILE